MAAGYAAFALQEPLKLGSGLPYLTAKRLCRLKTTSALAFSQLSTT